jgi:hypothetical protein
LVTGLAALVLVAGSVHGAQPPKEDEKGDEKPAAEKSSLVAFEAFDGTLTLNWKPVRPDPSHVSLTKVKGALTITTQRGSICADEKNDPVGEGIQAKNIYLVDNPLSDTADFAVTTCVSEFTPDTLWQQAGLICYEDDDNYLKWGYEYNSLLGSQAFCILVERQGKHEFEYVGPHANLKKYWVRLTKRGDKYEYALSKDGKEFDVCGQKEWGGAPKKIGLLAKNGGNKSAPEIDATFEFFELRSPPPPVEEKDAKE